MLALQGEADRRQGEDKRKREREEGCVSVRDEEGGVDGKAAQQGGLAEEGGGRRRRPRAKSTALHCT